MFTEVCCTKVKDELKSELLSYSDFVYLNTTAKPSDLKNSDWREHSGCNDVHYML
jgi:hypothetical protein